jgi:hypothetical protein
MPVIFRVVVRIVGPKYVFEILPERLERMKQVSECGVINAAGDHRFENDFSDKLGDLLASSDLLRHKERARRYFRRA